VAWEASESLYDDLAFAACDSVSFKDFLSFLPIRGLVHVTHPHLSLHATANAAEESCQPNLAIPGPRSL